MRVMLPVLRRMFGIGLLLLVLCAMPTKAAENKTELAEQLERINALLKEIDHQLLLLEKDLDPPKHRRRSTYSAPVYRGPEFWGEHDPGKFRAIFHGNFADDSSDPYFRLVFTKFVDEFRTRCADHLPVDHVILRTVVTEYRNGVEVKRYVEPEPIRVDRRFAPYYLEYNNSVEAWGLAAFLRAAARNDPESVFGPGWWTIQLFGQVDCNSVEIWQLEENLLRIATRKPLLKAMSARDQREAVAAVPGARAAGGIALDHLKALRDPLTNALWTSHDALWNIFLDGQRISWSEAVDFCDELVLGGVSEWRMPTVGELSQLFDNDLPKTKCGLDHWERCPVRLGIQLSVARIWSSTVPKGNDAHRSIYQFVSGIEQVMGKQDRVHNSALCIHGHGAAEHQDSLVSQRRTANEDSLKRNRRIPELPLGKGGGGAITADEELGETRRSPASVERPLTARAATTPPTKASDKQEEEERSGAARVSGMRLRLGEPLRGRVASHATTEYRFEGVDGATIIFDVITASGRARYRLRSPEGEVLFDVLGADWGPIVLPESGEYVLSVSERTGAAIDFELRIVRLR